MDFVSYEQQKAVFANMRNRGTYLERESNAGSLYRLVSELNYLISERVKVQKRIDAGYNLLYFEKTLPELDAEIEEVKWNIESGKRSFFSEYNSLLDQVNSLLDQLSTRLLSLMNERASFNEFIAENNESISMLRKRLTDVEFNVKLLEYELNELGREE